MRAFFLVLFFASNVFAQNIAPLDLFLLQKMESVDLAFYFLVNYKDLKYEGVVKKNAENNDVHRFSYDDNFMEIYSYSITHKSVFNNQTCIISGISVTYFIYTRTEYDSFIKQLRNQGFEMKKEGKPDKPTENHFWIYGQESSLRMIVVYQYSNHYMIQII